ncbi:hypothetical protein [Cryobacterium sp. Y11]|uniref:hypothetical protein n=1 Tax=Cryobacterium sp. Y11 TaxID=2045016 RepID=UPI000CE36DA0|nr:hypothetical protein [Cryobacterium sp. Y11]
MWSIANPRWGEPESILSEARIRSGQADALRTLQTTLAVAQSQAQSTGWTAVSRDAFAAGICYEGPKPASTIDGDGTQIWHPTVLVDNHSLVATSHLDNTEVLRDLPELIYE